MATDRRRPLQDRAGAEAALLACFVSARPDLDAPAELGARLLAALDDARLAWPDVALSDETFVHFLAPKLPEGEPVIPSLDALHGNDLYLACACARGDARALARLDRLCTPVIDGAAANHLGPSADQRNELRQRVHQLLLAPRETTPAGPAAPRVADFSGRGTLAAWVRVVAIREAIVLSRRRRRELAIRHDALAHRLEPDAGPELDYFKRLYRDEFKLALAEAIEALSERDRTLLRQHTLEGLSVDRLAEAHGVHRATAARWVDSARQDMLKRTRRSLTQRLRMRPDELDSVMRLIDSQLDVTLSGLLRQR